MSPLKHRKEERPQHSLRSSFLGNTFLPDSSDRKSGLPLLAEDIRALAPAVVAILTYAVITHLIFDRFCPMLILTGWPCPGCGMTRALFWALTGQFARAWSFQPSVYGWILFGLAFGVRRYLTKKGYSEAEKKLCLLTLILLLLCSLFLYGYRIFNGFPDGIAEPGRTLWEAVNSCVISFM